MKNRKLVIVSFMIIAALTLSIGYAALSTTLTINGTAGVSAEAIEFTNDVIFTGAQSNNETFGTAAVAQNGQTASFTVSGITQKDDRVQFTYTIKNNSEHDVNIEITTHPTTSATDSKFSVSTALGSNTIAAGQSITATVTVILNETVTQAVNDVSYVIVYTATSIDA